LRNALTDTDKRDDSWQKYDITDCKCCINVAGWGLASRLHGCLFLVKQEEILPVLNNLCSDFEHDSFSVFPHICHHYKELQ
jgi:hypothetical protein